MPLPRKECICGFAVGFEEVDEKRPVRRGFSVVSTTSSTAVTVGACVVELAKSRCHAPFFPTVSLGLSAPLPRAPCSSALSCSEELTPYDSSRLASLLERGWSERAAEI